MSYRIRGGEVEVLSGTRWRKGEFVNCLWCGKQFARMAISLHPEKMKKYCSTACAMAEHRAKGAREGRVYKKCVICGSAFKVKKSQIDRYKTCGHNRCRFLLASQVTTERHKLRRQNASSNNN